MVLLRMGKAAKYCGLNASTIRKYIDNGTLRGIRFGSGGYRYIDTSELDRLMNSSIEKRGMRKLYSRDHINYFM